MLGGSGSNKGGAVLLPTSSPYNLPLMDLAGIQSFENTIIAGIPKATGNAKLDGDMTEAWAWVTRQYGPRSGTSYSAHVGTLSVPEDLPHPDRCGSEAGSALQRQWLRQRERAGRLAAPPPRSRCRSTRRARAQHR